MKDNSVAFQDYNRVLRIVNQAYFKPNKVKKSTRLRLMKLWQDPPSVMPAELDFTYS